MQKLSIMNMCVRNRDDFDDPSIFTQIIRVISRVGYNSSVAGHVVHRQRSIFYKRFKKYKNEQNMRPIMNLKISSLYLVHSTPKFFLSIALTHFSESEFFSLELRENFRMGKPRKSQVVHDQGNLMLNE